MVDEKKIALNPAYELSFLKKKNRPSFWTRWTANRPPLPFPSPAAQEIQPGGAFIHRCNAGDYGRGKEKDLDKVTFTSDTLRKYFPKSYTPARMRETIIKLLEQWQKKRQRDQER